jgi:glycosyltransferase involved in cell wall biosynthesis
MLSIVIPAKNEENAITKTVGQINVALKNIEHEIILVDDGSSDATVQKAKEAGVKVISHPHNLGYGAAIKTGIKQAKYEIIAITDADGTYPIDKIPDMLETFLKGFDMVVGKRTGKHYFESIFKMPLRFLLKLIVEYTAGRKVPDVNSGLRIFTRKDAINYLPRLCNTFSFTTSLTLAYMMNCKTVTYVPVPYEKRIGKSKVKLFKDTLGTLQYIVEAIVYYNPIKIYLIICFISFLFSIIIAIAAVVLVNYVFAFAAIMGCFFSALFFSIGLIAVMLKQIMLQHDIIEDIK